ncbi:MAG: DUF2927 domain-containing protein [Paracoccaceae bacterium]|nr:DUF2927 domain-containing protein [Paracoccaceae bacterium]
MRRHLALLLALVLAACAPAEAPPARRAPDLGALPAMKSFAARRAPPPTRPNAEIARDFLELTFHMESGRTLPALTRFEAPVRVGLRGPVPATARADLDRLVARLRAEAGIDIARARPGERANLVLEFLPRATLQRVVPQAACFVVPRDESFARFRRHRRAEASAWALLATREAATVFIPADVAPQEVRDCLHEEVAQALGPLNDLYRLPDSVFNDDNFHTVLTGFDMLILRATYSPELASGMGEAEVARRLPALLARLNPRGRRGGGRVLTESRPWIEAIEDALGPRASIGQRRTAAARALALAENASWQDPRLAFSHFTLGRVALAREYGLAVGSYLEAARLYGRPGTEVQAAHVAMQLAAFALSAGHAEEVIALANRHAPVALRAENAALLATFMLVKAEALDMLGRSEEARAVRLDSLGWARYGFGSEAEVRMRVLEIAALRPRAVPGGVGP